MTPVAVVMMVIAMVTVWGGLIAGIINLARHPEVAETEPDVPPTELWGSPRRDPRGHAFDGAPETGFLGAVQVPMSRARLE
ncbi:methionine/alanine import family NSS transporter small subunit [Microbacterium suwonense]|uniref:Methionine/alanine importer small subunit n=1 Tax=Microbacterium suwonense TaxID=683047 RepID=A0ABN6X424_9MICO|nr:hypothetical protein GCM10025863_20900 [Microbacterium suwonense]